MAYSFHIINHSKKLRNNLPNLLQHEHAILVRWFLKDSSSSFNSRTDFPITRCHGHTAARREGISYSATNETVPAGTFKRNISRMTMKVGNPLAGPLYHDKLFGLQLHSRKGFSSDSGLPPHQEIGMPSLSPTMTEGNIARWLKKEGDKVSLGEVLCEVETDKATVEMESMEDGYLAKIIKGDEAKGIQVGEKAVHIQTVLIDILKYASAHVLYIIAITVEDEEDIVKFKDYTPSASGAGDAAPRPSAPAPPKEESVEQKVKSPEPKASKPTAPSPSATTSGDRIFASPLARRLAEENNGTGQYGNIVKADIDNYLASCGKEVSVPTTKSKDTAAPTLDYVNIPHSQIRKVTASRLLFSKQSIPHYYLTVDSCVDKLMDLRSKLNAIQEADGGKRISVNDLVIKAAALALRKVPQCNSSWTDEYIRQFNNVNINVAVQTDNRLYVPVIRDADKKGLSSITEEVKRLAQKAKENSLKPEDYQGGTFTVSNLGGAFGIKQFCAIVNPPQAGILAVGSAEKRVVPGSGADQFQFANFMSVTLSCDHRVIDGAIGAEWLKAFKGYIENPETMLL